MTYKIVVFAAVFLMLSGNLSLSNTGKRATENDTQEETIWLLEKAYISNYQNADIEAIIPFWHDRFLGWPDSLPGPADKKAVIGYTRRRNTRPGAWDFKIEPEAIRITGNIAVNHYTLHISGTTIRVTHTWIKEGDHWKILGGMSNRQ
mgnify:CR=1 FL=1